MMTDFAGFETLNWTMRLLLAQMLTLFLFCLSLISFAIPWTGEVRPHLLLAVVFYWAVYRPTLIPPWYVFTLGLLADTLSNLPLGLNAFILIAVHWIVRTQRVYLMGQSFLGLWIGFAVTCFLAACAQWSLFALVTGSLVPTGPTMASVGLSILVFPLVSLLLVMVHRILPVASKPLP